MKIRSCPLCGEGNHTPLEVLNLGSHPLADTFIPTARRFEPEEVTPLLLVTCQTCGHFFSGVPTSPFMRYAANEYSYETANSRVSLNHFLEFARSTLGASNKDLEDVTVLDVGSNDGTLLESFRSLGVKQVVGVDPSPNMAELSNKKSIPTCVAFFDEACTTELRELNGGKPFSVIVSANVLNHADDSHGFMEAISQVLEADGLFVFEVPNVVDLVSLSAFETIYHEHVHYWSLKTLRLLLEMHGFTIKAFEALDYMCGSLRVYASRMFPESPAVRDHILSDKTSQLLGPENLESFARDVVEIKLRTLEMVAREKLFGTRIVGIGAATKGNTLLNYLGVDGGLIDFVTDTSASKIGKLTPGSRIPIVSDDDLSKDLVSTLALILPWNLDYPLREKFAGTELKLVTPQVEFGPTQYSDRKALYGEINS